MRRRTALFGVILFVSAIVFAGCMVSAVAVETDPPSTGGPIVLFAEDFSGFQVGTYPDGWEPQHVDKGIVQVIADPTASDGKALMIKADAHPGTDIGLRGPIWDERAKEATTVAIEFKVRHVSGVVNSYVMVDGKVALHWTIGATGFMGSFGGVSVGQLQEGWNHVRLVANYKDNEVYIYLNDMDDPAAGPASFRGQPESWEAAQIRFTQAISTLEAESYFDDVKIWTVD